MVPTEDETNSVVSSVFSLGDSVDTRPAAVEDEVAEAEFSQVVDGIKKASLKDGSSPGRPSRPPPSAADDRPVHPLSPSDDDHDSTEDGNTELDDTKAIVHCLFCNATSENLESNMKHMRGTHGLFIPEQEYLIDQEGLVKWLSSRVRFLHECLYCGMIRHTTTGIQTHMRDKGHCMIAFDAEEQMVEVGQFYDFRSTYSDESMEDDLNDNDAKRRTGKLGARRKAPAENDENEDEDMAEGDGEGWETDDSEPVASGETGNDTRPTKRRRPLRPTDTQQIYYDDEGLHLPSGRLAGHRSLARYYRQNLQNYPTPEERASRQAITDTPMEDGDSTVAPVRRGHDQKAVTRANGGLGMLGVSDAKKREVQAIEKRDRKRAQQQQSRYQAGNEKRHNSQKHFRVNEESCCWPQGSMLITISTGSAATVAFPSTL